MEKQQNTYYGVGWYTRKDWNKLKEVSVDSDALDNTYEEWLLNAENSIRQLKEQNIQIIKVHIKTIDLIEWCKDKSVPIDGKARSQFAAQKLQEEQERAPNKAL
jgi:hypothetical protein